MKLGSSHSLESKIKISNSKNGKHQSAIHRIKRKEKQLKRNLTEREKIEILLDTAIKKGVPITEEDLSVLREYYPDRISKKIRNPIKGYVGEFLVAAIAYKYALERDQVKHNRTAPENRSKPDVVFRYKDYDIAIEVKYYPGMDELRDDWLEKEVLKKFKSKKYCNHTKLCIVFGHDYLIPYLERFENKLKENKVSLGLVPLIEWEGENEDTGIFLISYPSTQSAIVTEIATQYILPMIEQSHKEPGQLFIQNQVSDDKTYVN